MQRVKLVDPLELIRKRELARMLNVHAWTNDHWRRHGRIPPPIVLSPQVLGWRRSDIENWLKEKQEAPKTSTATGGSNAA